MMPDPLSVDLDRPRRDLETAKRRYLTDAAFHARVNIVLQKVLLTHDELSGDEEGLVITAAALALDSVPIGVWP